MDHNQPTSQGDGKYSNPAIPPGQQRPPGQEAQGLTAHGPHHRDNVFHVNNNANAQPYVQNAGGIQSIAQQPATDQRVSGQSQQQQTGTDQRVGAQEPLNSQAAPFVPPSDQQSKGQLALTQGGFSQPANPYFAGSYDTQHASFPQLQWGSPYHPPWSGMPTTGFMPQMMNCQWGYWTPTGWITLDGFPNMQSQGQQHTNSQWAHLNPSGFTDPKSFTTQGPTYVHPEPMGPTAAAKAAADEALAMALARIKELEEGLAARQQYAPNEKEKATAQADAGASLDLSSSRPLSHSLQEAPAAAKADAGTPLDLGSSRLISHSHQEAPATAKAVAEIALDPVSGFPQCSAIAGTSCLFSPAQVQEPLPLSIKASYLTGKDISSQIKAMSQPSTLPISHTKRLIAPRQDILEERAAERAEKMAMELIKEEEEEKARKEAKEKEAKAKKDKKEKERRDKESQKEKEKVATKEKEAMEKQKAAEKAAADKAAMATSSKKEKEKEMEDAAAIKAAKAKEKKARQKANKKEREGQASTSSGVAGGEEVEGSNEGLHAPIPAPIPVPVPVPIPALAPALSPAPRPPQCPPLPAHLAAIYSRSSQASSSHTIPTCTTNAPQPGPSSSSSFNFMPLDKAITLAHRLKAQLALHVSATAPKTSAHATSACDDEEEEECQVCMSRPASVVFIPCGHTVCCGPCAIKCRERDKSKGAKNLCILCQQEILEQFDS